MRGAPAALGLALALALAGCGEQAPLLVHGKPVEAWVKALHDPDARTRKRAAEALGNAGAADPAVVPALTVALKDRDPAVRRTAALCLLRIGPEASAAAPTLEEVARKDRDRRVRESAARALEKVRAGP